jgi:hypothetical protein
MRRPRELACLIVAVFAGCSPAPIALGPSAPHGGMLLDLPDNQGYVEIIRQKVADQPGHDRLRLYYLNPELKPMTTMPTGATLKPRDRSAATVEFRVPSGSDPSQAGMLESPDLSVQGDISGELKTTIADKPVGLSINVR